MRRLTPDEQRRQSAVELAKERVRVTAQMQDSTVDPGIRLQAAQWLASSYNTDHSMTTDPTSGQQVPTALFGARAILSTAFFQEAPGKPVQINAANESIIVELFKSAYQATGSSPAARAAVLNDMQQTERQLAYQSAGDAASGAALLSAQRANQVVGSMALTQYVTMASLSATGVPFGGPSPELISKMQDAQAPLMPDILLSLGDAARLTSNYPENAMQAVSALRGMLFSPRQEDRILAADALAHLDYTVGGQALQDAVQQDFDRALAQPDNDKRTITWLSYLRAFGPSFYHSSNGLQTEAAQKYDRTDFDHIVLGLLQSTDQFDKTTTFAPLKLTHPLVRPPQTELHPELIAHFIDAMTTYLHDHLNDEAMRNPQAGLTLVYNDKPVSPLAYLSVLAGQLHKSIANNTDPEAKKLADRLFDLCTRLAPNVPKEATGLLPTESSVRGAGSYGTQDIITLPYIHAPGTYELRGNTPTLPFPAQTLVYYVKASERGNITENNIKDYYTQLWLGAGEIDRVRREGGDVNSVYAKYAGLGQQGENTYFPGTFRSGYYVNLDANYRDKNGNPLDSSQYDSNPAWGYPANATPEQKAKLDLDNGRLERFLMRCGGANQVQTAAQALSQQSVSRVITTPTDWKIEVGINSNSAQREFNHMMQVRGGWGIIPSHVALGVEHAGLIRDPSTVEYLISGAVAPLFTPGKADEDFWRLTLRGGIIFVAPMDWWTDAWKGMFGENFARSSGHFLGSWKVEPRMAVAQNPFNMQNWRLDEWGLEVTRPTAAWQTKERELIEPRFRVTSIRAGDDPFPKWHPPQYEYGLSTYLPWWTLTKVEVYTRQGGDAPTEYFASVFATPIMGSKFNLTIGGSANTRGSYEAQTSANADIGQSWTVGLNARYLQDAILKQGQAAATLSFSKNFDMGRILPVRKSEDE